MYGVGCAGLGKATKTTSPSRASVLPSIAGSSVAVREHAGVSRLVAAARRQESATLLATLFGRRGTLGLGEVLRPTIGGDDGREVSELLRLQCEKLVAGLCRSEEHTSELQSLMRISYAVFCLKKKTTCSIQY